MINIKIFAKRRNTTSTSQSSSSSSTSGTATPTNDWFYFNDDNGFVTCRYPLCSVDNVVAFADGTEAGGGSGGGSGSVEVVDNLESTSTEAALSANMGRNLKQLIDNIQTQGGGTSPSNVDWQNIQNKPSTYPPSAHTHAISDVTGLQTQLTTMTGNIATNSSNLTAHINDSSVHVTQQQHNVLSQLTLEQIQFIVSLMNMVTISNGNLQINGNVHAAGNVVANVQTV